MKIVCLFHLQFHQFFFPRMKKELPSGIGTIFSFGPENSGFNGATPAKTHTHTHIRMTSKEETD